MNGNKPQYLAWYENDFEDDVKEWKSIPKWIYRTLLQKAFFCKTRPYLPSSENELFLLSGCDDRRQWNNNKEQVLSKFDFVEVDGELFLSNPRLMQEWRKFLEISKNKTMAANTRWLDEISSPNRINNLQDKNDASAMHVQCISTAHAMQVGKVGKNRLEKEGNKSLEHPRNFREEIPVICRQVLGMAPEPIEWRAQEFKELVRAYGSDKVLKAFRDWATIHAGEVFKYPLLEFTKVADGILSGIIAVSENQELASLLADMYAYGGVSFTGQYRTKVGQFLLKRKASEILMAWKMFVDGLDEFQMKQAVKNFCSGGAEDIFRFLEKEREEGSRIQQEQEELQKKAQEELKTKLEEIENKEQNTEGDELLNL